MCLEMIASSQHRTAKHLQVVEDEQPEYAPLRYGYPFGATLVNFFSEPARADAMRLSWERRRAVASSLIFLYLDDPPRPSSSALMPIMRDGELQGWINIVFSYDDILVSALAARNLAVDVTVRAPASTPCTLRVRGSKVGWLPPDYLSVNY
jgi:hypothetical protein